MSFRRSAIRKRRVSASEEPSARGASAGPRLASVEDQTVTLRAALEAQLKRIQTIQAQLEHLGACGSI
jgi:hypothetical protein